MRLPYGHCCCCCCCCCNHHHDDDDTTTTTTMTSRSGTTLTSKRIANATAHAREACSAPAD